MGNKIKIYYPFIDSLKGFVILFVIAEHCLQRFFPLNHITISVIHTFSMPTFMFISGYLSYALSNISDIRKRLSRLMIPFFSWIALAYIINLFEDNSSLPSIYSIELI